MTSTLAKRDLGEEGLSEWTVEMLKSSSFVLSPQESTVLHSDSKDSFLSLAGTEIFMFDEEDFEPVYSRPVLFLFELADDLLESLASLVIMRAFEALESLGCKKCFCPKSYFS